MCGRHPHSYPVGDGWGDGASNNRGCSAKSVNKQIEDLFAPEHGAFTGEGLRDQKSRPGGDRYARVTTNTRFRDTGNRTDLCAVCNR
jgi:hypothetical protein